MLRPSTVFILGAGVSHELGLPLGGALKSKIVGCLPDRGTRRLDSLERALGHLNREEVFEAADRIRDGLPYALSIDNFIEHRRGDELLIRMAKTAIARSILSAEAKSKAHVSQRKEKPLPDCSYMRIFQMISEGVHWGRLERAFERVAFINFNYDRCLQLYLHGGLVKYSGLSERAATDIVKGAQIKHVYGSLGDAPWLDGDGPGFGDDPEITDLAPVAERLKTFSEEVDSQHNETIRTYVANAQRLIFLGGAYHPQNLQLIRPASSSQFNVYGTVYEPAPDDPDNRSVPPIREYAAPIADTVRHTLRNWPMASANMIPTSEHYKLEPLTNLQLLTRYRGDWMDLERR